MRVLLADGDHGVLARGHRLLANRPVARDIARIHARIVGALQTAFLAVTFIKLTSAIGAWRDASQLKQFIWWAISAKKNIQKRIYIMDDIKCKEKNMF